MWALLIKEEVQKQLKAKFIEVVEDTHWLANIVPVPKKDRRVRMCVDYRDLNKACLDSATSNTTSSAMYSFMDSFSGYNQIMMSVIDKLKTSFTIEWGIFLLSSNAF